jgi:predicted nucleic acid-binding protein
MIVFDASTLILLAKMEILGLFIADFGEKVAIPEKVKEEVLRGSRYESALITKLIQERAMHVLKVRDTKLVRRLIEDFNIDVGEAEMLALGIQEKASLAATDDRNTIKACKIMNLNFTTAIAFLVRAYEKRLLKREDALGKLQELQSFARYKRAIIETARRQIEGVDEHGEKDGEHTNE